jgi:hypothetical protein
MIYRVRKIDGEYRIVLRPEVVAELGLFDGAGVEIKPVDLESFEGHRHVTNEEAMAAFEATLPFHEKTYRELAKGPDWKAAWWLVEEAEGE